ncbi:microtubule-actin cross-linking factor 1, partial [Biomphalaria glabrata]
ILKIAIYVVISLAIDNLLSMNVESDIEARALYLSQRPLVFDSVYRGQDVPAQSKIHKDCVSAKHKSWSWIQTVNECLGIHSENTANYHQFYHDVCHLEEDMLSFLLWMDSLTVRAQVKTQDPNVMLKHFRLINNCWTIRAS